MTPGEEINKLKTLIWQFESVYKTTKDANQRARVAKQLIELKDRRDRLMEMYVAESSEVDAESGEADELSGFPILKRLVEEAATREDLEAALDADLDGMTSAQKDMYHLSLYTRHFEREYLPFLTGKQLKLDFKFSMERDSFYRRFQVLLRKMMDLRDEQTRIAEGAVGKGMERDVRSRGQRQLRLAQIDASRFFRAIQRFSEELIEDAQGDGVKCTNGDSRVHFESIEGVREFEGLIVTRALDELLKYCAEAVEYLNVPEIEMQERDRADRY